MTYRLAQIQELGNRIECLAGKGVRDQVMAGSQEITEGTSREKLARWLQGVMARLDALVDEEQRSQIMAGCGGCCATVHRAIERSAARRRKCKTFDDFLAAEEHKPPKGTRLVRAGNVLHQFYTPRSYTHPMRCFCPLAKALPEGENMSPTWCQCARGFAQKTWGTVVGRPVEIEVRGTCLTGAQECEFIIHL